MKKKITPTHQDYEITPILSTLDILQSWVWDCTFFCMSLPSLTSEKVIFYECEDARSHDMIKSPCQAVGPF
jgi:hypothetical protein